VGCVRLVEPAARTRVSALGVEEQRVNVIVDVEEPPPSIGDGFRVDARIEVWASDSALTIPASALVRAGREWAVFTIASGRAVQRTIAVGRMGGGAAQLLGGLAEGEEVIVFPSDAVRDGTRVRARIAEGGNR
jgi:HlyD family secretion protein